MATHSAITDAAEIHEPKGATTATDGQVLVADGLGGTAWKTPFMFGVEDYNDSTTSGTPITLTPASTFVDLTNDGAGAFTNTTYKLQGLIDHWNTSTNRFDFTDLELGDTIDIRIDVTVSTAAANSEVELAIELGLGGSPYTLSIDKRTFNNAGAQNITRWYSIYIGDTNTLNNPAKLKMSSDNAADTVVVNGWYIRTGKRKPHYV